MTRELALFVLVVAAVAQLPEWIKVQRPPQSQNAPSRSLGCMSLKPGQLANIECISVFLEEQMNQKGNPYFSLPQTYRIGVDYVPQNNTDGIYPEDFGYQLSIRADVYDAAMTAIFFMSNNQLSLAKRICDTLVLITDLDLVGDGRSRSAYNQINPIFRDFNPDSPPDYYTTPVENTIYTGNLAFIVIALGRYYLITKEYKYLKSASLIANFIHSNLAVDLPWGGYAGGFKWDGTKDVAIGFRSTEHNIDLYAAARLLFGITNNPLYETMMSVAKTFVSNMWNEEVKSYMVGTLSNNETNLPIDEWNLYNYATDAQTWKILSDIDNNLERNTLALEWVQNYTLVTEKAQDKDGISREYLGTLFGAGGTGIQLENTASAAMAFFKVAGTLYDQDPVKSQYFYDLSGNIAVTLTQVQKYAANGDGHGIVAALQIEGAKVWPGNEFAGGSWRYFPVLHTAASAWAGLALKYIYYGDIYANPYADYSQNSNIPLVERSSATSNNSEINHTNTIAIVISVVSLIASVALLGINIVLVRKLKAQPKTFVNPPFDFEDKITILTPADEVSLVDRELL